MKYTIFTPTYNRESELNILYDSLKKQSYQDFEWLIIDDGSTDNTEQKVNSFIKEGNISIRYIKQMNGGKHRAFNKAIEETKGEFMVCVDSDDFLRTNAIEEVDKYSKINDKTMAICFLCVDLQGNIIGNSFPKSNSTFNLINLIYKYKVRGDKFWVFKHDILKDYRFPEYKGEKFITEGVLTLQMSIKYDVLVVNEVLLVCEYRDGGLTSIGNKKLFLKNSKGAKTYYKLLLQIAPNYKYKLFYVYNFLLYSIRGRKI